MARRRRKQQPKTYNLSPLTENSIHSWVGEAQFNRGLKYVEMGLVQERQRRGSVVHAVCLGKQQGTTSYQVSSTVVQGTIVTSHCTCSIGKHGICPHIAATLTVYSRAPQSFLVVTFFSRLKQVFGWR